MARKAVDADRDVILPSWRMGAPARAGPRWNESRDPVFIVATRPLKNKRLSSLPTFTKMQAPGAKNSAGSGFLIHKIGNDHGQDKDGVKMLEARVQILQSMSRLVEKQGYHATLGEAPAGKIRLSKQKATLL